MIRAVAALVALVAAAPPCPLRLGLQDLVVEFGNPRYQSVVDFLSELDELVAAARSGR